MTSQSDFDQQNHTTWLSENLPKFETLEELRDALEKAPKQTFDVEGGTTNQNLFLASLDELISEANNGLTFEQAQKNGLLRNLPGPNEHKNFAESVQQLYNAQLDKHKSDTE